MSIKGSDPIPLPLGNDKFKAQIELTLGRKVGKNERGRPVNERESE